MKNYLVFEEYTGNGVNVIDAVVLNGRKESEYYWKKIITAFSKDMEDKYFFKLKRKAYRGEMRIAKELEPSCYRNDITPEDGRERYYSYRAAEYAFVLNDGCLSVYHNGKCLCHISRNDSILWRFLSLQSLDCMNESDNNKNKLCRAEILYQGYQAMQNHKAKVNAISVALIPVIISALGFVFYHSENISRMISSFFIAMY